MSELPPRPGVCSCKVCVEGYIRVPNWETGKYEWHECPDPIHSRLTHAQPDAAPLPTDGEQERDAAQVSSDC